MGGLDRPTRRREARRPRPGLAPKHPRHRFGGLIGPQADLAREQWHRQLLQRNRKLSVEQAVDQTAGIYSTAPTSYLSFVARLPGFARTDLDRALYTDRTLARLSTLRGSGFLIPLDLIPMVTVGTDRGDWYLGAAEKIVGERRVAAWGEEIIEFLDGRMATAREMTSHFGVSGKESEALRFILKSLAVRLEVVAAGEPAGWRSNQYRYAIWSQWFSSSPDLDVDPDDARIALAEWYLGGHGPAKSADFAWWGGMKKGNAIAALRASSAVEKDGWFDLPDREPAPEPSGVRLLPIWDTALVRQVDWRRMVPEEHFDHVYDASGNLTSTVIADGEVVGVWDRSGNDEQISFQVAGFETLRLEVRDEITQEAATIAEAVGATVTDVSFSAIPVDLRQASRNRFMSPLSG